MLFAMGRLQPRGAAARRLGLAVLVAAIANPAGPLLADGTTAAATGTQDAAEAPVAGGTSPRVYQVGTASWYGREHAGKPTASGAAFDPERLTAAHRTLPLGTRVRVTSLATERSVIVTINDRGPYIRGRIIDLSLHAAEQLGMTVKGLIRVRIEII